MNDCLSPLFGCDGQRIVGSLMLAVFVIALILVGIGQMIWAYWSAYQDRKRRQMAIPSAIRQFPTHTKQRRSQAACPSRWPTVDWFRNQIDQIQRDIIQGGGTSGF